MNRQHWPVVGIPCDVFTLESLPFHGSGEKYINAVALGAKVRPVLLPALDGDLAPCVDMFSADEMLGSVQGIFLTGNMSNVAVHSGHPPTVHSGHPPTVHSGHPPITCQKQATLTNSYTQSNIKE